MIIFLLLLLTDSRVEGLHLFVSVLKTTEDGRNREKGTNTQGKRQYG